MITQSTLTALTVQVARLTLLDLGPGVARIRGYSLERPAHADIAPTGVLLFELPLLKPCGVIVGTAIQLQLGAVPLALASGLLEWARVVNGNGDTVFDMGVGLLSSTAEMRCTTLSVTANKPVAVRTAAIR